MNNIMSEWNNSNKLLLVGNIVTAGLLIIFTRVFPPIQYHVQVYYIVHLFVYSMLAFCYLRKYYIKTKGFSRILMVIHSCVILLYLYIIDRSMFDILFFSVFALFCLIGVVFGGGIVYNTKKFFPNRLIEALLCSFVIVIISFAGIYSSLYTMFFSQGYEVLIIDNHVSSAEALLNKDFLYYSADRFFGTNISNVSVGYLDYLDLHNSKKAMSLYPDSFSSAEFICSLVKFLSFLEYMFFLLYISLFIMLIKPKKEENEQQCVNVKQTELINSVKQIKNETDNLKISVQSQNKLLLKIYTQARNSKGKK